MMLFKVAWRNVWRHRTRSAVIVISVAIGIWAGLFVQGYINGILEERVRTAIEREVSHIQIHHPAFKDDHDPRWFIPGGMEIVSRLQQHREVKAVTGRLKTQGMIATATGNAGIMISGVDPVTEDSVSRLSANIIEGHWFSAEKKNEIIVGEKLMKKLKMKLNSKVVLTFLDREKNITAAAFRIKAVFKTQNTPYDEMNVFVERADLENLIATPGEVSEIAVLLKRNEALDPVFADLTREYPQLKTETWREVAPEIDLMVSTSQQSLVVYMAILMLALAFGIINTMLMAVLERTREIGMLMALGMNRMRVFFMILLETLFLVITGAPAGLLLSYLTIAYFGNAGIDQSAYAEVYSSFGYSHIVYPYLEAADYLFILRLVIITSLLSSLLPARRALSLDPAEAIRK